MRAVLLAVLLYALPAQASYLEVHYFCGKPRHMIGFLDGQYVSAKWKHIVTNSELLEFFNKVLEQLPLVNGQKELRRFDDDLPPGYTCPVSA